MPRSPRREVRLERRERDEQTPVLVVRGEEIGLDVLRYARPRGEPEPPVELTDAPFDGDRSRIISRGAVHSEGVHDLLPDEVLLPEARQLEHPVSGGEDPPIRVADDEPRGRCRVVVVEKLEQKSEAAVRTADAAVAEPLDSIVVDGTPAAIRADEVRHRSMVAARLTGAEPV